MSWSKEMLELYASAEFKAELDQMEEVIDYNSGGPYEWDDFLAYYHTGRDRFYYLSDSGCSCNSITDGVTGLGDFGEAATLHDLVRFMKAEKARDYGWSQSEVLSATQEILNFRKGARA